VKNRFQSLPFKFNLQHYKEVAYPSSECRLRASSPARADPQLIRRKIKLRADNQEQEAEAAARAAEVEAAGAGEGGRAGGGGGERRGGAGDTTATTAASASAAALDASAGGQHWQWPSADPAAAEIAANPKRKTKKQKVRKNATSYDCVYLRAAPAGAPPPAVTSATGRVVTPGCQIVYMDHSGCHQLNVF
jgi:hypothetical protein